VKKVSVCLLVAVSLITIGIARWKTGSADFGAAESSLIAVQALAGHFEALGFDTPRHDWLEEFLATFLTPGAYLLTRVGVLLQSPAALGVVVVVSWWTWIAGARIVWFSVGRLFGVANAKHFYFWLLLHPPWRPCYRVWLSIERWYKVFLHGKRSTAEWTGVLSAMTIPFVPGESVFIGRLWAYGFGLLQPLGIRGERHVTVVAAPGSGKTRWLMGWLGMIPKKGSAFVVDCDGQMINALGAGLERAGHKIFNLDPYRLTNFPGACWNALDEITAAAARHGRQAAVRFAQTLAEALIQEQNSHQPIFAITARGFMHGLILYVWLFEPPERRNLIRVRELLTRGMPELVLDPKQDPFDLLLRQMEQAVGYDDECDGKICAVIARAAAVMRSGKGREGNPFRTAAMSQTAWLDFPEIEAISTRSDFVGEDLKTGNPCVFICLPVVDIQNKLSGFVRALSMMTMYAFQNIKKKPKVPCAFCIDEMPSLGRMEILETAAPVFRKYGIRLVVITQDLERLKQAYPQSYGTFIGNSQATLWMGTDHQRTLEELSKILGNVSRIEKVNSGAFSDIPARMDRRDQALATPDQLREFLDPERLQIIVTRSGKPPLRVTFEGYDKALPVWACEQDQNFREPVLRACTRMALGWLWAARSPTGGTAPRP